MNYGQLYIIPNENKILGNVFYRQVVTEHLPVIQEFSDYYHLGYQFKKSDYQDAPCLLAKDGHVVIKTVDDAGMMICYLPEFITDNQNMWFYEHINLLNSYSSVNGFQILNDGDTYRVDKIHGLDAIMRQINQSNIIFSKRGHK